MRDRDLEDKIGRVKEIIGLWNRFNSMAGAVMKGAEPGEDMEADFLELKSELARKFQSLSDRFPMKTFPDEELNGVLSQAVSLAQLKGLTSFAASEFQNQWHKVYISLNRQLGHLESERDELRKVSSMGMFARRVRSSLFFKLLVAAALIAGLAIGSQKMGLVGDVPAPAGEEAENGSGEEATQWRDYLRNLINRLKRDGD